MTPLQNRASGKEIRYAAGESSLGLILVGRSQKGICAILLGDEPQQLFRELQRQFPRSGLLRDEPGLQHEVAAVATLMEAPSASFPLPLDLQGTAFQLRVWQALGEVPPGATVTYGALARTVSTAAAVRAVGRACAANPIAVAVPCHRVVASDGSLTGYRWGVERKKELLARESAMVAAHRAAPQS